MDVVEPPDGRVTGFGEKELVTPKGLSESDNVTAELNPFNDVTVTVESPELPCWIVRESGDADKEKSGAGIISGIVVECDSASLVPVTVRLYVPAVAVPSTKTVSRDCAEPSDGGVTELSEKDAVTPAGLPETDKVTGELNPFIDVTVTVELLEPPCWIVIELGDADKEKSGDPVAAPIKLVISN